MGKLLKLINGNVDSDENQLTKLKEKNELMFILKRSRERGKVIQRPRNKKEKDLDYGS